MNEILMLTLTFNVANTPVNMTLLALIRQGGDRTLVVGPVALIDKGHGSITLEVGNRNNRSIHWKLLIVSTETMTVCIRVGEKAGLEDRISGRLNVRNEV